ncbi:MAG TPA: hypothetical protein VJ874_03715 [Candidatus Thermoplasmatota archaeon]|nr:hypothetical protein [Candidatus Thermoplasmatota archaeon]
MAPLRRPTIPAILAALLMLAAWPPAATGDDGGGTEGASGSQTDPPSQDSRGNGTAEDGDGSPNGTVGQSDPKGLRYDFDRVEATYAASFQVVAHDVGAGDWGLALAGPDGTLNVTLGVLRFWREGDPGSAGNESFLKVEGPNGTRRFLGNSGSWTQDGNGTPATAMLEFSSHKRLENDTVVKDFAPPVLSVHLWRAFDASGNRTELLLSTWGDWEEGQREFWKGRPARNLWALVPDTFREAGEPLAGGDA